MSTPDWREAHDAGRDSGYAAGRAEAGAELTSLRARVAEADRLLREWHHYYHNPASTDAEGTDDDTSTWLAGLSGNKRDSRDA